MKQVIKRTLRSHNGTEGPTHDPYGYTDYFYTVEYDDLTKTILQIHLGLGEYFELNDTGVIQGGLEASIEEITKMPFTKFLMLFERQETHCHSCKRKIKRVYYADGMPGETMSMCGFCDAVLDVDFNESAIM